HHFSFDLDAVVGGREIDDPMAIRVDDPVAFGGGNGRDDQRPGAEPDRRAVDAYGERAAGILASRRRAGRDDGERERDHGGDRGAKRTDDGQHAPATPRRSAPMNDGGRRDAVTVLL